MPSGSLSKRLRLPEMLFNMMILAKLLGLEFFYPTISSSYLQNPDPLSHNLIGVTHTSLITEEALAPDPSMDPPTSGFPGL